MGIVWPVASFNGGFESVVAISVSRKKYFSVGHCVQTADVPYSCLARNWRYLGDDSSF